MIKLTKTQAEGLKRHMAHWARVASCPTNKKLDVVTVEDMERFIDEHTQEKQELISRDEYFAKLVEIGDMDISANLKLSCEMILLCAEFIKNFTEEHGRYPEQQDFFNLVDSLIKNNS